MLAKVIESSISKDSYILMPACYCPYKYEIKDGKLIIDGENYGDAEEAFAHGRKIIELVRVMAEVEGQSA